MANIFSRRLFLVSIMLAISTLVGECHATWGDDYKEDPNSMLKGNFEHTEVYVFSISRHSQSA